MAAAEKPQKPTAATESRRGRSDRSKRLLDLVMMLLRARTPVPFRSIRDQFVAYQTKNVEAGLRAFERDKADLLELGVPIRYITPEEDDTLEEGGYVVSIKRYRLPEVHLNADEISALVLAASVAGAVPGVSYASIVDLALRKLAFDFPDSPDTPVDFPPRVASARNPVLVHFPTLPAKKGRQLGDRFAQLEAATRNRKRVTLRYQSASTGYVRERELDPYGLVYRDGSWLVVGYCHLRQGVRSFRLDRIADLKIAPRPKSPDFERPEDFDLRAYANSSPWTFQAEPAEKVVLEFRPAAANLATTGDFGRDAVRSESADGSVRVEFSCANPDYVVSRVMAAKGDIRVLEGVRLEARLADELAAVARHYEDAR